MMGSSGAMHPFIHGRLGIRRAVEGSAERGFTLLELLIAMVLLAVTVVVVTGAMRLGYRSLEKGDRKIESLERMRTSLSIIDAQIQSFSPVTGEGKTEKELYFEGSEESLKLMTNYSIWGGRKGYVRVEYRVETGENGRQSLHAIENTVGLETQRETLLFQDFDRIYFEYFYKDPTEEAGEWVTSWSDPENVPRWARLHLLEGAKDTSMIIPVRVQGAQFSEP
jgi:general secretion pathway protein J